MAADDLSTPLYKFKYMQCDWGDVIYASKAEMQSLGLAVGVPYPGEPGGPKRTLNVTDPRGFKTKIEVAHNSHQYVATIHIPGRENPEFVKHWKDFAPGVSVCDNAHWYDEYVGTAECIEAAGLVRQDQLPGKDGVRKVRVTIFSDGTVANGHPTANSARSREPGTKIIERASKKTYRVRCIVPPEEKKRREKNQSRADAEYKARMRVLPRPARLFPCPERLLPRPALSADFAVTVEWESCGWRPQI